MTKKRFVLVPFLCLLIILSCPAVLAEEQSSPVPESTAPRKGPAVVVQVVTPEPTPEPTATALPILTADPVSTPPPGETAGAGNAAEATPKQIAVQTVSPTLPPLPESGETYRLPIDFSPGAEPLEEGYLSEWEYEDPTIHVRIERGRENETTYWTCEVRIADASQLRSASADGFDSKMTMPGTQIAKRMNAVVAIDGDYFCYTEWGFILRQGHLYLNKLKGGRDVLLIDEDGDFHIVRKAERKSCQETINGKKVINAFFFGPVLVENGVLGNEFRYRDMAYDYYSQRMAISQIGKLHYKIVCCESPHRGSKGMKLAEFAAFCKEKGCVTAYNLDGGDSTMLYFHNEKINDVDNPNMRPLADIIYFASAYTGNE